MLTIFVFKESCTVYICCILCMAACTVSFYPSRLLHSLVCIDVIIIAFSVRLLGEHEACIVTDVVFWT